MSGPKPKIVVEYRGNVAVATFTDEKILDESHIKAIEESVCSLVKQGDYTGLVLDFSNVEFLSSAVLGILIRILAGTKRKGAHLRLCGINEKVYDIFKITRLNKVFDICLDVQQAVESIPVG